VSIINQPELKRGTRPIHSLLEPVVDKVIRRAYVDVRRMMPERKPHGSRRRNTQTPRRRFRTGALACIVPFTRLVVTYDGTYVSALMTGKSHNLGSVLETGLADLWTGEAMLNLRNSHLERRFAHPTCRPCREWKAIRWGYDYITALNDLFGEHLI